MKHIHFLSSRLDAVGCAGLLLLGLAACGSQDDSVAVEVAPSAPAPTPKTLLDLNAVVANPAGYEWFDFRPNVQKLILAGAAETEHVAILWYTVTDGSVGLHYHSKTESVYVIDGTQTDAKGVYPTGTVYFNPPGSGHAISDSSGFFLLAYASPPDFASTDLIEEYTPVRIDTVAPDLMSAYPFVEQGAGVLDFDVPLDGMGGMSGKVIDLTAGSDAIEYQGNYVLVLGGGCSIDGVEQGEKMLAVAQTLDPEPFTLAAAEGSNCRALGVSF